MKKLIFLLIILFAVPGIGIAKDNNRPYLPFSKKGKYGKLPTKKARQKATFRSESWCYRQWKR